MSLKEQQSCDQQLHHPPKSSGRWHVTEGERRLANIARASAKLMRDRKKEATVHVLAYPSKHQSLTQQCGIEP